MIKVSPQQYATSLYQLLAAVPADKQDQAVKLFAQLLKKNNHLHLAERIIAAFGQVYCRAENIVQVQVTTAEALPASQLDELKKKLQEATKQEVEMQSQTDKSLIGGIKLQIDDTLIDGSIQKKLSFLKV